MKNKKKLLLICIISVMALLLEMKISPQQAWAKGTNLIEGLEYNAGDNIQHSNEDSNVPPQGYLVELGTSKIGEGASADTESSAVLHKSSKLSVYGATGATSGTCGDHATWSYADGVLTIEGSGVTADYSASSGWYGEVTVTTPWAHLAADVTSIVVKSGITSIGDFSFATLSNVTEVSLPETVTAMGEGVFYGASSLETISLPSGIKVLSSGLFAECYQLKQITYGNITEIESYALQETQVETVNIPATLAKINNLAFFQAKVSNFTAAAGNPVYTVKDGIIYTDNGTTLYIYPSNKAEASFQIPAAVKKIGDYGFAYTQNLKTVNFANVTTLGEGAFYSSSLTGNLVLSDLITSVGYFTFEGSLGITSVTFGKGLETTEYRMFEGCTGITSIHFGALQTLGMRTFLGCDGLKSVTLPDSMTEWEGSVFNSCSNLESFTSKGLKVICYADFAKCYALKTVTLGAVEKINREAFYGCSKLKAITLPATTQYVNATAFPATTQINCLNTELVPFGQNGLQYAETVEITGTRNYDKAYEVLKLVNQERTANGLSPLYMDESLLESAMVRAAECSLLFSHTRPDSTLCMTANEKMYAENIAAGQTTAATVMNSWMNSEGHRANILEKEYGSIGIGCFVIDGCYYWTQCFSIETRTSDCQKPAATKEAVLSANVPKDTFSEAATTAGIIIGSLDEYTYQYTLTLEKQSLAAGEKTTVKVKIKNPGHSRDTTLNIKNMVFSTSDKSIATVDQQGTVTAKKKGTVTITVKGKYFEAAAKLKVTTDKQSAKTIKVTTKTIAKKRPVISSVSQTKKGRKVKIKYNKLKGSSGYQVQYSTTKKFKKKTVLSVKKTSATTKKLKKGKQYYVRVRAYIKKNNKTYYSKWSKIKKTKKIT